MKELSVKDYELVSGGGAPLVWAGAGVAAYVGSKMYSGEEITALGLVSSAVGGGVGGAAAHVGRIGWASSITSSFLGGATEGLINSSFGGASNSSFGGANDSSSKSTDESGSDYGDGTDYQY